MKNKSRVVIWLVVGCLMMLNGAAWAGGVPVIPGVDNANGTVTKNGLVWLKNAGCLGMMNWDQAMARANSLKSGECGLTDGSKAGQWRLPTRNELIDIRNSKSEFDNVHSDAYWSATTGLDGRDFPFFVLMHVAKSNDIHKSHNYYVWPVRSRP